MTPFPVLNSRAFSGFATKRKISRAQKSLAFNHGTVDAVFLIHGTFIRQFGFIAMSEQATTKLIGLSLSAIFLMMLMLRAITS